VVGNREIINGVKLTAQMLPSFIPEFYVDLALRAVRQFPNDSLKGVRETITRNSAELIKILDVLRLEKSGFDTVPFMWAKIERRRQASAVTGLLYRLSRLLVLPGTAFGDTGEGFLRFSLTVPPEAYSEAVKRVKKRHKLVKRESE